jgi:hypothetical protein
MFSLALRTNVQDFVDGLFSVISEIKQSPVIETALVE